MSNGNEAGLPSGWAHAELGDVLPLNYGKGLTEERRDNNGEIPVYGSSGVVGRHSVALTSGPTLIIGRKGAIGEVFYSEQPCWPIDTTYYSEARPELNLSYFAYLLRFFTLGHLDKSTAIPSLRRNDYNAITVPVAPLREQARIVSEIEKQFTRLDTAVVALKRVRANLKRYRAAVLKAAVEGRLVPTEAELARREGRSYEPASELLKRILAERRARWEADQIAKFRTSGKLPKDDKWKQKSEEPEEPDTASLPNLPDGWAWTTTGQVGAVQLGRQRSPKHHSGPYMRPYLRVANVFEDRIDTSDVLSMNFTPTEFETYKLGYGDILLNEGQSLELVGRAAMYRDEVAGACFQNTLIRFRPYSGLGSKYSLVVFLAYLHNKRFQKAARWTVNIAHLGADRLSRIEFPLPPELEQSRIVTEVERRLSFIEELQMQVETNLNRSERLRQAILKHAFEGKLVPQDPSDEPASVLLERIRAEREAIQHLKQASKRPRKVAAT
jgi:type I restriction enzyme, S subunit